MVSSLSFLVIAESDNSFLCVQNGCYDSDSTTIQEGIFVKGGVYFRTGDQYFINNKLSVDKNCVFFEDNCKDKNFLLEGTCNNYKNNIKDPSSTIYKGVYCSFGCDEGKCIKGCFDGKLDQDEELVDCGGVCKVCQEQFMQKCSNQIKDDDEEDIDCGGICKPCKEKVKKIYPNHCFDFIKNFDETAIDCGGSCITCDALDPNCSDGYKDGFETNIDCGGKKCQPCLPPGEGCTDSDLSTSLNFWGIYDAGYISYIENGISNNLFDFCLPPDENGKQYLQELVCSNGKKQAVYFPCEKGCKNKKILIDGKEQNVGYCIEKYNCNDPDINSGIFDTFFYKYNLMYSQPSTVTVTDYKENILQYSTDTCADDNTVNEKECEGENIISEDFTCPFFMDGCGDFGLGGFCCVNKKKCVDLDNGKDISNSSSTFNPRRCDGTLYSPPKLDSCAVSFCENGSTKVDSNVVMDNYCGNSVKIGSILETKGRGDSVVEYFCDNNDIGKTIISCPSDQSCFEGRCQPSNPCTDTDGEKFNQALYIGSATGLFLNEDNLVELKTINDTCYNDEILLEASCMGDNSNEVAFHKLDGYNKINFYGSDKGIFKKIAQPTDFVSYIIYICKTCKKDESGNYVCKGKCVSSNQGAKCDLFFNWK